MTRCWRDTVGLKSSVYNQTGESCVDQLALQRTMGTHLRRVLLAKSVVDSRNPRYTRAMQRRCQPSSCKLKFLEGCPSDETIDKLAYDTEHHPSEIIKVQCRPKRSEDRSPCGGRQMITDANCPCLRPFTGRERSSIIKSNLKNEKRLEDLRGFRSPQFTSSPNIKSRPSRRRSRSSSSECSNERAARSSLRGRSSEPDTSRKSHREEDARYAKFVYDITQEIVQNGLYTDRELRQVFEKHLQRYAGRLNKRKMLYEIYQLKISLNMEDDSEDDDELEANLVYAERFESHRVPKPPTPPKVLNENKVFEKLSAFKHLQEIGDVGRTSSPHRKNVVLIDPNPKFVVTEFDILTTLVDNDVKPEQIERIYNKLYRKSKDTSNEGVQVDSDPPYLHRIKKVDKSSSTVSLDSVSSHRRSSPGILRKDATDFARRSSSPRRKKSKEIKALEKCSNWQVFCDCKSAFRKKDMDFVGHEKVQECCKERKKRTDHRRSVSKIPSSSRATHKRDSTDKPFTSDGGTDKRNFNVDKEKRTKTFIRKEIMDNLENVKPERAMKPVKAVEKDERRESKSKAERSPRINEEIEEIEEEIESVVEEFENDSPDSSLRTSKDKEKGDEDKSDDEIKELSSVQEEEEDLASSVSSKGSEKFSEDVYMTLSESDKTAKELGKRGKVARRYSTMRDYFDKFATIADQKIWRISEDSTTSSTSSSVSVMNPQQKQQAQQSFSQQKGKLLSRVVKRRTSSNRNPPQDTWKRRLSTEITSDFYANSNVSRYCDVGCRDADATHCSESCKFVRTNCRNLSNTADCLNREDKSESTDSWSSTS